MSNHYSILFTQNGFDNFRKEYDELLAKRPSFVQELSTARDMGDRSENAAYKYARRKLSQTDSRLSFLKRIIEHAKVIIPDSDERASIGCSIEVAIMGKTATYSLVGEYEADPTKGLLSYRSPVGQALSGKRVGDEFTVQLPAGNMTYKVLNIFTLEKSA